MRPPTEIHTIILINEYKTPFQFDTSLLRYTILQGLSLDFCKMYYYSIRYTFLFNARKGSFPLLVIRRPQIYSKNFPFFIQNGVRWTIAKISVRFQLKRKKTTTRALTRGLVMNTEIDDTEILI